MCGIVKKWRVPVSWALLFSAIVTIFVTFAFESGLLKFMMVSPLRDSVECVYMIVNVIFLCVIVIFWFVVDICCVVGFVVGFVCMAGKVYNCYLQTKRHYKASKKRYGINCVKCGKYNNIKYLDTENGRRFCEGCSPFVVVPDGRELYTGRRGGTYYLTLGGNKRYV